MRWIVAGIAMLAGACSGSKPAARPTPRVTPPVPLPAPTVFERVVGTADPFVIERVADDGSWVAICQARADTDRNGRVEVKVGYHGDTYGDDMVPYLVHGGGEGEAIAALVSSSRDGRWIAAIRDHQLALLDTRSWTWTSLPRADVQDDGLPFGPHRAASIAAGGRAMTFFRGDDHVVIRNLDDGRELEVKVPHVWRVEVDPAGHWARVYATRKDTDGDGKLTWPTVRTSLSDRSCRGPVTSYSTSGSSGDTPDVLWLDLDGGTLVDEGEHVLGVAGERLVRLGDDHVLRLGDAAIADAACDAQVAAIHGEPARVAYTCAEHDAASQLFVVGPDLPAVATTVDYDRDPEWRRRIGDGEGPLCGSGGCIDVATGKRVDEPAEVPPDPRVEALEQRYAPAKIVVYAIAGKLALIASVPTEESAWTIPKGPLRWVLLSEPETQTGLPKEPMRDPVPGP